MENSRYQNPMRLRVSVVDDETRICNGVARFLTAHWPEIAIQKFSNAIDALAAMDTLCPELLITDLRMPEMDGLELIERATRKGVQHCIILTGYDEFDLMQRAIRLRTQDYLLKPVDREQLYRAVETVWHSECDQIVESVRLMIRYGVLSGELARKLRAEQLFCGALRCALLRLPSEGEDAVRLALYEKTTAWWRLEDEEQGSPLELLCLRADEQAQAEEQLLGMGAAYVTCPAELSALPGAYRALQQKVQPGTVDIRQALMRAEDDPAALRETLGEALRPLPALAERYRWISARLDEYGLAWERWRLMLALRDVSDEGIAVLAKGLAAAAAQKVELSPLVRSVCELAAHRYTEELKLAVVAGQVFVTPNYLSTVFHQETGLPFTNYINRIRIDRACERMLGEPAASTDEIAASVGFPNTNYFFKIFRQVTALTPGEFRRILAA